MADLARAALPGATHMLVASIMGRALYASLGWRVRSRFATAFSPERD